MLNEDFEELLSQRCEPVILFIAQISPVFPLTYIIYTFFNDYAGSWESYRCVNAGYFSALTCLQCQTGETNSG